MSNNGPNGNGGSGSRSPVSRRQFLKGAKYTGVGVGVAAAGGGSVYGASAIFEQLFGKRFLPGIDKESFETEVDSLVTERNNAEEAAEQAAESFEEAGFSLNADDYRSEGLGITKDIRIAVPEDSQSTNFNVRQEGESRVFRWLDGTEPLEEDIEGLVEELDEDIGLSEQDKERIANDELVSVASQMVPYVGDRVLEDGSGGQPVIGQEQIDEFKGVMSDIREVEDAYSEALGELEDSSRELGQQKSVIQNADREKIQGLFSSVLPLAGDSEYSKDEHYSAPEAREMAEEIAGYEEETNDAYGEAVREFALVKALRHSGAQVAEELGVAHDIYEEGEFDASGRPKSDEGETDTATATASPSDGDWISYGELDDCEQERVEGLADNADYMPDDVENYQFNLPEGELGTGDRIDWRDPETEKSGEFGACMSP